MNPQLILLLWRERWGKGDSRNAKVPNSQGKLTSWCNQLAGSLVWSWPGVTGLTLVLCVLLFALIVSTQLSLNSQTVFSIFMVGMTLYARRYAGTFVTQVLIGLSFIASTRYLYWRFNATLGQNLDLDFILGFCLCVAELHLWLLIHLGFIQTVWPLRQASVPLPSDSTEWPTVDIFIPSHGQSHSSIELTAIAALALDWPKKKIKTYILDGDHRNDIKELADSIGATYLAYSENPENKTNGINHALPQSKGELIAIFDCNGAPDKNFLTMAMGWFVHDVKLGMLQTLYHFLMPAPSARSLKIFDMPTLGGSCAVFRRSMLLEVGGVTPEPVTGQAHTALKMQALGYGNAYIGLAEQENPTNKNPTLNIEPPIQSALELFKDNRPSLGNKLRWKQGLNSLQTMLQFYYPIPQLFFFTAPLAYLLADAHPIQTSAKLFAAYAVPHLILRHLAQARMQGDTRFPVLADIRETALAWYMLVPTTITVIRTKIGKCVSGLKGGHTEKDDPFDLMMALPYAIILLLNLAGFVAGIARLLSSSTHDHEIAAVYLLWTTYNVMLLAAILAVAEESRHIRWHTRWKLRMPAMIKLPFGRSVSCTTVNFPESPLALTLPSPVTVETGLVLSISIFLGYREYVFSARVASVEDKVLRINIEESAKNDYDSLGIVVFSRGQDWPKWLPNRDADHPLPAWASRAFVAMHVAALSFTKPFSKLAREMRFGSWIQIWKKRK